MRNLVIRAAVLGTLGLASAHAMATGLVPIPGGFTVSGGTSPYTLCNTTGNFGSATDADPDATASPTSTSNNTCAVFPSSTSQSPATFVDSTNFAAGAYTKIKSTTSSIILNDTAHTGGTNVTIGTYKNDVFRVATAASPTGYSCIYAVRVSLTNVDYWTTKTGTQTFEVNDIAYGGFNNKLNGTGAILAGYFQTSAAGDDVAFRIGRTFSSVQHRSAVIDVTGPASVNNPNSDQAASGYVAQPKTLSTATAAIIGLTNDPVSTGPGTPTAAQQSAAFNSDWVDFTNDVNYEDADGSSRAASSNYYVQSNCSGADPSTISQTAGAIRLRQTGQETPELIEISLAGYSNI